MKIPWADDKPLGSDKLEHAIFSGLLYGWLLALGCSALLSLSLVLVAGVGIEVLEWRRFVLWERSGKQGSWPYLCDLPSRYDLLADCYGLLISYLLLRSGR